VRDVKKGHFESRTKYSFRINRFQKEEARAAIEEKALDGKNIIFIQ
jgi:hypothetical protein